MRDRTYTIRNAMNIVKYYTDKLIQVEIEVYPPVSRNTSDKYALVVYLPDGDVLQTMLPRDIALALQGELYND